MLGSGGLSPSNNVWISPEIFTFAASDSAYLFISAEIHF